MIRRRQTLWTGILLVFLVALYLWSAQHRTVDLVGTPEIEQLFRDQQSGIVVEFAADVIRLLADDRQGSRHQRFIVELGSGHTVLISHNIDLAPRIDSLAVGDRVAVRGQYEWNERGGVVHWTHRDPDGRRLGGWIKHDGRTYR
jgi:hypothetical protein